MRPSEKRLLLILCVALFLAFNLIALRVFLNAGKKVAGEIAAAKSAYGEEETWIGIGKALRPADAWISGHPLPRLDSEEASAQLLKTERESAEGNGLKITEENLLPGEQTAFGAVTGVSVKLSGPFAGVVKLLYALQNPSAWRTVDKLTLRSDAQPPNVVAELEIRQLFQPASGTTASGKEP